jgi:predicted  nucleic acid-binding Zn-ribbon protein
MAQDITELKERNVELMSILTKMKELQHRDQKKLIGLESELETTNRKVDTGVKEIHECKAAITKVETQLVSLSRKEETSSRFDRIKALSMGKTHMNLLTNSKNIKLLTGKRKE